jgi:TRAP-type mannitol/chloroaromatic compound transport system permease small subunit
MISFLNGLQHSIDYFSQCSGVLLSRLSLLMMLTLSAVVVLRYGFNIGIIAMQELVSYLHASVFMLGTAYALQQDSHVRVDIFYRNFSPRVKAWVNCVGGIIFLMPLCGYFLMSSWDFVVLSWTVKETSAEPGGLPAVFLFKSLIPLMAIMLSLQALAEIIRQGLFLVTGQEEPKS